MYEKQAKENEPLPEKDWGQHGEGSFWARLRMLESGEGSNLRTSHQSFLSLGLCNNPGVGLLQGTKQIVQEATGCSPKDLPAPTRGFSALRSEEIHNRP